MYAGKVSAVLFGSQERAVLVLYGAAEFKPKVKAEDRPPCSGLYVPDQKSFLFEVSYYKKKINLEVFHCLTDGTGALNFLKELVKNYLYLIHKVKWIRTSFIVTRRYDGTRSRKLIVF